MIPTEEQQALIDHPLNPGDLIKAVAYAGTGKTSTLVAHARSHRMKGLYIAFNKSVADEATGKFPANVKCSTIHALAFKALPPALKKDATTFDVSHKHLRERYGLGTYDATLVIKTLERFLNSADPKLDSSHAAPDHLNRYTDLTYPTSVIETAQDLWRRMQLTTDRDVKMTLNGALKMFQLSKPNLKMDIVYLDEAQDSNPVTIDLVTRQTEFGTRVVLVGDPYQQIYCQVEGTLVTEVVGTYKTGKHNPSNTPWEQKLIQNVNVGDTLVSYDISNSFLRKTGSKVSKVGSRYFRGRVVAVTTESGLKSRYTPDHDCLVRMSRTSKMNVVYLMRKGNRYRVGMYVWRHNLNQGLGAITRARQEGADAVWVLSTHVDRQEAALSEMTVSWKYRIPTVRFFAPESKHPKSKCVTQRMLDKFWESIGDNKSMAEKLLSDLHKDIDYPLWNKSTPIMLMRRSNVIKACNLETGMEVLPLHGTNSKGKRTNRNKWEKVTVSREYYSGNVYSLEVENDHTYVGDGIITHNCWRGAVNALDKFRNAPEFRITKTWRFGTRLAECASGILKGTFNEYTPLTGNSDVPTTIVEGNPRDVQGPVTILCRNNVTVIQEAFRQASNFKKIDFIGYKPQEIKNILDDLIDIFYLCCQLKDKIKNRYIKMFNNVEALKATSNEKMDTTMLQKVSLATHFGANIASVVESILSAWDTRAANVKICTAHRSKGLEFDTVALTSDYYDPDDEDPKKSLSKEEIENEMSVVYVAITRAKRTLILPSTFRHLNGGNPFDPMETKPPSIENKDEYEAALDDYAAQLVDGLSEDENTVPF